MQPDPCICSPSKRLNRILEEAMSPGNANCWAKEGLTQRMALWVSYLASTRAPVKLGGTDLAPQTQRPALQAHGLHLGNERTQKFRKSNRPVGASMREPRGLSSIWSEEGYWWCLRRVRSRLSQWRSAPPRSRRQPFDGSKETPTPTTVTDTNRLASRTSWCEWRRLLPCVTELGGSLPSA